MASGQPHAPLTLASAGLPARVRRVLERVLVLVSEELDAPMHRTAAEFERELFRLADQARNPDAESGYMLALRNFRLNRADLVPRFMFELEAALAGLHHTAPAQTPRAEPEAISFRHLSLVEDAVLDEDTVLREIASRQEGRGVLTLHLLGQRFGVLAGAPAYDTIRLPLGPHAMTRAIRSVASALHIDHDARLLLYRMFDRQAMAGFPQLLDRIDALLVEEGILPALTFVPVRVRPHAAEPSDASAPPAASAHQPPRQATDDARPPPCAQRPHTAWLGEAPAVQDAGDDDAFAKLQQLLSGRRALLGKLRADSGSAAPHARMATHELIGALQQLQRQPASAIGRGGLPAIRQAVLAQTRQLRGKGAELAPEDSDIFELLELLYAQIGTDLRKDAPTSALVDMLQLPLLRLALLDRAFFLQAHHPARQLLNTVAESAASWLDRDELDPQLAEPLRQAVTDVVEDVDGGSEVFARANARLHEHLQAQVRKAETLERRHVEAARGKEKLEIAKMRAAEALEEVIGEQRLPRFVRALLNQAWTDVLTLTLLRQGENSDAWRRQIEATGRIIAACGHPAAAVDPELTAHVESSLGLVGYQGQEAAVIAQRLTSGHSDEDDPASRTELAVRLKARVRLGEDKAAAIKPVLPPRTPAEQAHYEHLRELPFGAWIEFVTNQQGAVVRRRLSWYSPITDNALFVNQRGQRVGEQSLDSLARMCARGQARLVTAQRGHLVDRAWQAAIGVLRSFAGHGEDAVGAPA